jgi:transketolase
MPCVDLFDEQSAEYRESVLPAATTRRMVVEAGVADGWWRYLGSGGRAICMNSFGESAPAEILFEHFGFSVDNVLAVSRELLAD